MLRKLLFFTAIKNCSISWSLMYERYQQMLSKGTPKVSALVAIASRLLRIIFALVKNDTLYRDDYLQKLYNWLHSA